MITNEKQVILRVVERFVQSGATSDEEVSVVCLPANKTMYVETIGGDGRVISLDQYRLGERVLWAGFSTRSQTVFLSEVAGQ
jgi:hypothetical protein